MPCVLARLAYRWQDRYHSAKRLWRANDDTAAAMDKQRAKACYVVMLSTANVSS